MIRAIVAIDSKRGMATDKGIPWQLPTDIQHFRDQTKTGAIFMGYGTYVEFKKPFHDRINYVAVSGTTEPLREGFEAVTDARQFLKDFTGDVWVIGGPGLLAQVLDLIDELDLTQLDKDFNCTKFFPEYQDSFSLVSQTETQVENDVPFRFTIWHKK